MKKNNLIGTGGNGGNVTIFAKTITGNGNILADGGDGSVGGNGGSINIISEENNFTGEISAKGGKSLKIKQENFLNKFFWHFVVSLGVLIIGGFILEMAGL